MNIQIIAEILSNTYDERTIFLLKIILENIYHRSFALREWNSQSNLLLKEKPEIRDAIEKPISSLTYQRYYIYLGIT